ncbi:hypothetical protein OROHE_006776 [Orobanche hederae]
MKINANVHGHQNSSRRKDDFGWSLWLEFWLSKRLGRMSSRNEEILKLKKKIIECEEETLRLLEEKQDWPAKYYLMKEAKERAAAELKRRSEFEKELNDLHKALKREEKIEKDLKDNSVEIQAFYEEFRKKMEERETKAAGILHIVDNSLSVELENRVEMEKRLENLNIFYEAVYDTIKSKKSNGVSIVREAELDHPGEQNGPRMRKIKGSKKSQ